MIQATASNRITTLHTPRRMPKWLTIALAIIILPIALGIGSAVIAGTIQGISEARNGTTITEDDPRWNCATMGNRVCGR